MKIVSQTYTHTFDGILKKNNRWPTPPLPYPASLWCIAFNSEHLCTHLKALNLTPDCARDLYIFKRAQKCTECFSFVLLMNRLHSWGRVPDRFYGIREFGERGERDARWLLWTGLGNRRFWGAGLGEIITLTNREPGSPLTRILSPEKSSLPRSRFQAIAFHFYPHSAKVKLYPPKTPKREDKKAAQRLTFLSKHVPGTQPLPFAIFFFATPWWYLEILSHALSCNSDLWFLGDRII